MSQKEYRVRFAPSPTGFLHMGSARTALYAWLSARHHQGKLILRIEDTDRERSTPQATEAILEGLRWLQLDYDEGPYFQSQRFEFYQTILMRLLDSGHAYYCDCTPERLHHLREGQLKHKQKPRYDNHCRLLFKSLDSEKPCVVRFKNPLAGSVVVEDQILGSVRFNHAELDDFILARSDGSPTYNFTVVADDYDMGITHVIRGNDHLNNTPRQINVLKALGASIPVYMHLPMIHGEDGKKLSKREGAAHLMEYQAEGFLPDALINYLVRLGWSHGDQEIFSREELIRYFDGQHLSKSPAVLNKNKLLWLNQHYLKQTDTQHIASLLQPFVLDWKQENPTPPSLADIVIVQRERVKTLKEMAEQSRFFYETPTTPLQTLSPELKPIIELLYMRLQKSMHWDTHSISTLLQYLIKRYQLKPGQLFQPLRMILSGNKVSPPIDMTLQLLGKECVLARLHKAMH